MRSDIQRFYDSLDDEGRYLFDERAAVFEYDGDKHRAEAEELALWWVIEGRV